MTTITFTKRASVDVWDSASITGFTGVLQVERSASSYLDIYAKTSGCSEERIFSDPETTNTICRVEVPNSVSLRIETDSSIVKAQYEAE